MGEFVTVKPVGITKPIDVTVPEAAVNVPLLSILSPDPILTTPNDVVVAIGRCDICIFVLSYVESPDVFVRDCHTADRSTPDEPPVFERPPAEINPSAASPSKPVALWFSLK